VKVILTGGTGFIGGAVINAITQGHPEAVIVALTRSARAHTQNPRVHFEVWDPDGEHLDPNLLSQADAVIHLAGEQAVGRRQTAALAASIRKSRVNTTKLLVRAIREAQVPPRVFVCGSAVGYYGDVRPEIALSESSPPGGDFLAKLCVDWEEAAAGVEAAGVRRVSARIGIVLGPGGGALEKMAAPIRAFVGGTLGDGTQMVSWIQLQDCARGLVFAVENESLRGPVNITAPTPVSNSELTHAIARQLGRPAFLKVPAFALKTVLGEGASPLLTGQSVRPDKLIAAGFTFRYPALEDALRVSLAR
jgi:hypothetical protein